jgi:NADPH:quinone reductase-like Zn-dependent oxidoreductase
MKLKCDVLDSKFACKCNLYRYTKAGGAHVTAVCSTPNVELVKSLGADDVIDYREQSVDAFAAAAGGVTYDKIIDAVGRYHWWGCTP